MDSYLAALAPEGNVETTGSGQRFGNSDVYQLRLPLMANERLKELAARQGTSPSALARDWVMQHLSQIPEEPAAPANPGPAAPATGPDPMWPQQDAGTQQFSATPGMPGAMEETDTEITIPRGPMR